MFYFSSILRKYLGGLQSKKVVSKIGLIKIMHLNKLFLLHFKQIWMVSNLGIEKDKEMSKLRPHVDLLGGFFNILQYIQTSTLLYSWT
jgi:hypothetical protein